MTKSFQEHVALKFQLYNSLFLNLPFGSIQQTGAYLPLLTEVCSKGFEAGKSPEQIVSSFFNDYFPKATDSEKENMLFNVIKYVERQVVLFDSVEDAAYNKVHDIKGQGTITGLFERARITGTQHLLKEKLQDIALRIVLTAHPTQFYPGSVLGIITDLNGAIQANEVDKVNDYLLQLGITPFVKKEKPTPYDEATSLIWFLENVFYESISNVIYKIEDSLSTIGERLEDEEIIQMGFWPGGDRDGNPFVNTDITKKVAARLRRTIQILYFRDIRILKRRLTFPKVYDIMVGIEKKLYDGINYAEGGFSSKEELLSALREARDIIENEHHSLFLEDIKKMITKVKIFGIHLAIIDIRQDSSEIEALYDTIIERWSVSKKESWNAANQSEKINLLEKWNLDLTEVVFEDPIQQDTFDSHKMMQEVQAKNGEVSCHRYIISNCQEALHVMKIFHLARTLRTDMKVDIVPLFETIDDLAKAGNEMEILYKNELYKSHLASRNNTQTIMLGFSDGTKDGGYLSANWAIFEAKEALTHISRQYGIKVVFFDGRGGPPARGGGSTHKFYASLGNKIEDKQVQITIQGQTISSNFGTLDSATYNIEQLLSAGLENHVFQGSAKSLSGTQRQIMKELAEISLDSYVTFKNHPKFLDYLEDLGTLPYYGETNIGSRPVKRAGGGKLTLKKLRAIPFVGSWSQMKQNVPGYFGLGTALRKFEEANRIEELKELYQDSVFFQTLIQNSMQSLSKCYFPLTSYLSNHKEYGEIWNIIHDEYLLSKRLILLISGEPELLSQVPDTKRSIELREQLVLPLLTIQQYALLRTRMEKDDERKVLYQKMVMRTMFGIINAGRNSA